MSRIAVMGAGSWGTALALSLHRRNGHHVALWSRRQLQNRRSPYLPDFALPPEILLTTHPAEALAGAEIVLGVVPSEHVRTCYRAFAPLLAPSVLIVSATKGLEDATALRMSEVIAAELRDSQPVGVLSGPSFAQEVAGGSPTAVTIASTDAALTARIQREFSSSTLRVYRNEDITGVELGGALKNVIAIAAGAAAGLGLGHNSAAALITRGIAEITRLALACGGRQETLSGLSGLGDLVLTCTGPLSRNRSVGVELGQGSTLEQALAKLGGKVAEGVRTTRAALALAARHRVEMPITTQIAAMLYDSKDPKLAIRELMERPTRDE